MQVRHLPLIYFLNQHLTWFRTLLNIYCFKNRRKKSAMSTGYSLKYKHFLFNLFLFLHSTPGTLNYLKYHRETVLKI